MRSSYSEEDVILLLKDITGLVEPQPAKVREKLIQSGKHYSEMLPVEYVPTDQYMQVYHNALKHYAKPVANAVGMLADKIIENKGKKMVLVSLARAGIPIGILVKRYIKFKYGQYNIIDKVEMIIDRENIEFTASFQLRENITQTVKV